MSQDGDDDKDKAAAEANKPAAAKADKADDKLAEKLDEKPAAKTDDKPAAKAEDKPAAKAEDKPAAKVDEKPAAKADGDKPAKKAEDKPAEKLADKPAAKADVKPAVKATAKEPAGKSDGVVRRRNEIPPTRKNEVFREPTKPGVPKVVPLRVPISALVGFAVIVAGALYAYFSFDVGWSVPNREWVLVPQTDGAASAELYVRMVPNSVGTTIMLTLLAYAPMLAGMGVFAAGLRDKGIDAKVEVPIFIPIGLIVLVVGGMILFLGHESGLLDGAVAHVVFAGLPIVAGTAVFCFGLTKLARVEKPPPSPDEPPVRQSYHDMMNPVITYPDGKLSAVLRAADAGLGRAEQVVLVTLLVGVTFIAASHAIADKIAHVQPWGHFKDDAIRGGTFAIALIGGAFATHQGRHLAMDLITRGLPPRGRLYLKVVIAIFTIAMVVLLVRSGFHSIAKEYEFKQEDKLITPVRVAYLIAIGGALVIVHTILHTIIDIDYLARGRTPPERQRSGH